MFGFHYPAYATKEDAEKEYDKVCGQSGIKGEVKYDPHKIGELIEGGETRFKCRGCPVMCEITMNGKNLVTPTECPYGHFRVDWQEVKDIEREGRTDCSKCIYYRKTFNRPPQLHDSTLLYEVQDEIVEDNMWKKIWCIHNMRMTKPMCPMFDDGKEVK